jgi:alpha-methylacyl-CoA racemase
MASTQGRQGPLTSIKVLEVGGIGPAPFCSMMLADMGADVIRIDRQDRSDNGLPVDRRFELLMRSRRSVALDLKHPLGAAATRKLLAQCDVLIEGFRPGVMERLGLGPEECLALQPRLVYGRMTGWGQDGPLADAPGHDINYVALSGALHAIGPRGGAPAIPLNLVGDFGGGAMLLAFGVLCGVLESRASGQGQVVDAAMVDGVASLMTMFYGLAAAGYWSDERGANRLDGGAPWYNVYETMDGAYVALGSNEKRFYRTTLRLLGLQDAALPDQHDKAGWPQLRELFASIFRTRTRDEWCALFDGQEACLAPVLSLAQAPQHPHHRARGTFVDIEGVLQPAPAPRFSRTPGAIQRPPPRPGLHTDEVLRDWGFAPHDITQMRHAGAIA